MDYILGFVLLLGILIFIHELGHFLVAKFFKVRVETFSIGMGKKIFSFTKGDTTYALSILPLGGYVKLTGQDPREEVTPELETVSFRHKSLFARSMVVLAGPIFNAVLALLIFSFLYLTGIEKISPRLGRVLEGSSAFQAGLRSGDKVTKIRSADGHWEVKPLEYADLESAWAKNEGKTLEVQVEREGASTPVTSVVTPQKALERDSQLGVLIERPTLKGVEREAPAPVIWNRDSKSWASSRSVPNAFYVEEVRFSSQGIESTKKISNFFDLVGAWEQAVNAQKELNTGKIMLVGIQIPDDAAAANNSKNTKTPESQVLTLAWNQKADQPNSKLQDNGLVSAELVIAQVKEKTPAEKFGLQKGDLLLSISGEQILSFNWFRTRIQELATAGKKIELTWLRNGEIHHGSFDTENVEQEDPYTEVKRNQFQIGAAFLALPANPVLEIVKADSFPQAVALGWQSTWNTTGTMLKSFYHIFSGDISMKTLGGPILIGKVAGESFKKGSGAFLRMMAFISLNLFILNLLPVPVLDGGHLVLFAIEAIRRKPVGIKAIEIWTTTGFFLLMGLIAIVFLNDLGRLGLFKIFS